MRSARALLRASATSDNVLFRQGWALEAAEAYCQAVTCVAQALNGPEVASRGLYHVTLVPGADQGGKSTFLRSLGLAQMMMHCGMFVPARRCQ
jgi:hypothetical protein